MGDNNDCYQVGCFGKEEREEDVGAFSAEEGCYEFFYGQIVIFDIVFFGG